MLHGFGRRRDYRDSSRTWAWVVSSLSCKGLGFGVRMHAPSRAVDCTNKLLTAISCCSASLFTSCDGAQSARSSPTLVASVESRSGACLRACVAHRHIGLPCRRFISGTACSEKPNPPRPSVACTVHMLICALLPCRTPAARPPCPARGRP